MEKPSIAMIGLGVMGANLARNIERHGYPVAVYSRSRETTDEFRSQHGAGRFFITNDLSELVQSMTAPRTVFIMIPAGPAVDAVIENLLKILSPGDIIVDGGNTYFQDTIRREKRCTEAGIHFMGVGISGGEEGALNGPSLMPGGPRDAWKILEPVLTKIAAYADGPCVTYIGPNGSGHFVKMVHNGIEYGDMQLIAEAYDLLRRVAGCSPSELSEIFGRWNQGPLQSFLIEITEQIFKRKDDGGDGYLVDKILDKAGQKGTGKWTSQVALDLGIAIPTISAAVDARCMSALKVERTAAAKSLAPHTAAGRAVDRDTFIRSVHDALYSSKIMSYAQGMKLLGEASREWKWELKLDEIAAIWKGGCIIRARFLDEIRRAFNNNPSLANLIMDPFMQNALAGTIPNLRGIIAAAAERGIPVPAFSASLNYYDAYRTESLPQNLTQAQRDFFGAHTFERIDREGTFHAQWS